MKLWNEFFEKEDSSVNEHHKETKVEQIAWICETLEKLSAEQVKEVYNLMEDMLDVE
jgi:hypothetical protein